MIRWKGCILVVGVFWRRGRLGLGVYEFSVGFVEWEGFVDYFS